MRSEATVRGSANLRRTRRWFDFVVRHRGALTLAVLASGISVLMQLLLFPHLSANADEGVYLLQAENLRQGHLTFPTATYDPFFQPWLTGRHDGAFFTKYLPGYPALLALSMLVFHTTIVVPAVAAALWVLGAYALTHELFSSRRTALIAAGFTLASPIALMQSGLYLTYSLSIAMLLLGTTALIRGARHGSARLQLAGGLAFGFAVLLRQYDVVLFGLPVGIYLLLTAARGWVKTRRLALFATLGALPPLAVLLAFDTAVTGSPLRLPLPATDPLDAFGFGLRRLLPSEPTVNFTPALAWGALGDQLAAVPAWIFGGGVALLLAALGLLVARSHRRERLLLAGLAVIFPLGYFPFWGGLLAGIPVLNDGAHYYLPAIVALTLLAAVGADELLRRLSPPNRRGRSVRAGYVVVAALAVLATVLSLVPKIGLQRDITRRDDVVAAASAAPVDTPAVVLVSGANTSRYVGMPYPFLRNRVDLQGPVLYAAAQGGPDWRVFRARPDRIVYGLRLPSLEPGETHRAPSLVRLSTMRGRTITLQVTFHSPVDRCLTAYVYLNTQLFRRQLTCAAVVGQDYTTTWTLNGADLPLDPNTRDATLTVGVVAGSIYVSRSPRLARWESRYSLGMPLLAEGAQDAVLTLPAAEWDRPAGESTKWDTNTPDSPLRVSATAGR